MELAEYARMHALEDHYWWFVGRKQLAVELLASAINSPEPRILDLGCGTGAVTKMLTELGSVVALDMSADALQFNLQKVGPEQASFLQGDGSRLPLGNASVDAVIGLDVFEHIERDDQAYSECFRVLRPGGVLVLTVPAFRWLWGPHDVALHHFRRYHKRELKSKLESAGFQVENVSFAVFFLFPIVVLRRWIERLTTSRTEKPEASLPPVPEWLNSLLIKVWKLESGVIERNLGFPWGSSLVAVARKKASRPHKTTPNLYLFLTRATHFSETHSPPISPDSET